MLRHFEEQPVGTAKRYADKVDRQMNDRVVRRIMESGPPFSLGREELELDVQPVTKTPRPHKVRAWVRYPDGPLQVDGEVVAWTPRAVAVRWSAGETLHKAWVWASAVEVRA
jgi:hypothetical protein